MPGGRAGSLYLVDPASQEAASIGGFSSRDAYTGGHGQGITSAAEGGSLLFVTDRTTRLLHVIDPSLKKIVSSAALAANPDYVRFISSTHEIWVTEPGEDQIEIFSLSPGPAAAPVHSGFISVPGGPEGLLYSAERDRAFTNLWKGKTAAIDVHAREISGEWTNGCRASRCLALDEAWGFLMTGCAEGKATVLDLNQNGKLLGSVSAGAGPDVISYNPVLKHLYLPGGKSATLGIVEVSKDGTLKLIREIKTAAHAHCSASDSEGHVWVCDPEGGRLLLYHDAASGNV
ncbi:MAG TPA: hypothetical protein VL688_13010 [Verrucomicrobiae bacterium]|nr:hypothetical protein [Verrucomicrobiae bacterium]